MRSSANQLLGVGVVDQHRTTGRRAQHARSRHFGADEAVHDRRLPRSRRAADDGQHRCVDLAQARQDIVLELSHRRGGLSPRLARAGQLDRRGEIPQRVTEFRRCVQQHVGVDVAILRCQHPKRSLIARRWRQSAMPIPRPS